MKDEYMMGNIEQCARYVENFLDRGNRVTAVIYLDRAHQILHDMPRNEMEQAATIVNELEKMMEVTL